MAELKIRLIVVKHGDKTHNIMHCEFINEGSFPYLTHGGLPANYLSVRL